MNLPDKVTHIAEIQAKTSGLTPAQRPRVLHIVSLHPELFPDLNMMTALQDFYRRFFNYRLTDSQAIRILAALPPATK